MRTFTRRSAAPSPPAPNVSVKTESLPIHLGEGATEVRTRSHPSWHEMIIECIHQHPEGKRSGVSRPTIKKYADAMYGLESSKANATRLSRAINVGVANETFILPKGPSGKVKLFKPKIRTRAKTATKGPATVATPKEAVKATPSDDATKTKKKVITGKRGSTTTERKASSTRASVKTATTGNSLEQKANMRSRRAAVAASSKAPSRSQ